MRNHFLFFICLFVCFQLPAQIKLATSNAINGISSSSLANTFWVPEAIDGTHFRLRKAGTSNEYIHTESNQPQLGVVPSGYWSSHWLIEKEPNTNNYRIKNRYHQSHYLTTAGSPLKASNLETLLNNNWAGILRPRLKVLYVVPQGQRAKPKAEEALSAIIAIIQAHFLEQLGVTFELEPNLVTTVSAPKTVDQAVQWGENRALIERTVEAGYLSKGNVVFSVLEGTSGSAGGSFNIVKMTGGFWNTAYNFYLNTPHLLSTQLHGWSHELGHAFGLLHSEEDGKPCFEKYGVNLGNIPSCIMQKKEDKGAVYNYSFLPEEKKLMLNKSYYDQYKNCAPFIKGRPYPTQHFTQRNIHAFQNANGRNVLMVEFWNKGKTHGTYSKNANGKWSEYDSKGSLKFTFRETSKDDWSVYLYDDSRKVGIQLDLHAKKVNYWAGNAFGSRKPIYDIMWARK